MSSVKYILAVLIITTLISCKFGNNDFNTKTLFGEESDDKTNLTLFNISARDSSFFYSIDLSRTVIYKLNKQYEKLDSVGGKGFGPGEYSKITHIRKSKNHLFVLDSKQLSMSVYSTDFAFNKSSVLEFRLLDFVTLNDSILIGLAFDMDSWSIIQLNNQQFNKPEYLHYRSVRSPEMGFGRLTLSYPYLLISHIFTNTATIYNIETKSVNRITNPLLPQRANMVETPLHPIPTAVVWSGGFLMDENLLQVVRNSETGKYSLYLVSPRSRVLARFDLDEPAESLIFREDSIWTLSDSTVYKYSLDQLSL